MCANCSVNPVMEVEDETLTQLRTETLKYQQSKLPDGRETVGKTHEMSLVDDKNARMAV